MTLHILGSTAVPSSQFDVTGPDAASFDAGSRYDGALSAASIPLGPVVLGRTRN